MYLKKVGSALFNNSKVVIRIFSTGSLLASPINSRKILKFYSIGRFFLLISALIASLLFGSRLHNCSSTFSMAAHLFDHD